MKLHDYHCSFSGLSLTHREAGFILLSTEDDENLALASLPIWGRYNGLGGFDEIQDGPNADLILSYFQQELKRGQLQIDFQALDLPDYELDSLDLLISLFFCAQIHNPQAISYRGHALRFALVSAHLTAQLMELELQEQTESLSLEELPQFIFKESLFAQGIYAPLKQQSLKLRCRFGLTMVGLQSLREGLKLRNLKIYPPGEAFEFSEEKQSANLLKTLNKFADDAELLQSLSDHLGDEERNA